VTAAARLYAAATDCPLAVKDSNAVAATQPRPTPTQGPDRRSRHRRCGACQNLRAVEFRSSLTDSSP
jgi:hypothetical protein